MGTTCDMSSSLSDIRLGLKFVSYFLVSTAYSVSKIIRLSLTVILDMSRALLWWLRSVSTLFADES